MNKLFDSVRLLDSLSDLPEGWKMVCPSNVFPSLVYVSKQEVVIDDIEATERELISEYKGNLAFILFRFLIITGVYLPNEEDVTLVSIDLENTGKINSTSIAGERVTVAEYNSIIKSLQALAPSKTRSETLAVLLKSVAEELSNFESTSAIPVALWDSMLLFLQVIRNIEPIGTIELATAIFRPFLKRD